ncbi:MAG: type II toxin-antitoxin system PemK/MazF family toxin [Tannerella sp.]|jgi:mRNA interferase MazF|nr:type II toxin-antitoxin system PemK/MazF family toxin [Tannerella sp.]
MNRIETGSIVLLRFPFTDGAGFKRRPALILKDCEDGDILVCRITSKIYNSKYDIYLKDWLKYGLKLPSVARIHKMATLETDMIEVLMGQIDDDILSQIKVIYKTIIEE